MLLDSELTLGADYDAKLHELRSRRVALPRTVLLKAHDGAAGMDATQHGLLLSADAGLTRCLELAAVQLNADGVWVRTGYGTRPPVAGHREASERKPVLLADGEDNLRDWVGLAHAASTLPQA